MRSVLHLSRDVCEERCWGSLRPNHVFVSLPVPAVRGDLPPYPRGRGPIVAERHVPTTRPADAAPGQVVRPERRGLDVDPDPVTCLYGVRTGTPPISRKVALVAAHRPSSLIDADARFGAVARGRVDERPPAGDWVGPTGRERARARGEALRPYGLGSGSSAAATYAAHWLRDQVDESRLRAGAPSVSRNVNVRGRRERFWYIRTERRSWTLASTSSSTSVRR